jgi:hypothetical protein
MHSKRLVSIATTLTHRVHRRLLHRCLLHWRQHSINKCQHRARLQGATREMHRSQLARCLAAWGSRVDATRVQHAAADRAFTLVARRVLRTSWSTWQLVVVASQLQQQRLAVILASHERRSLAGAFKAWRGAAFRRGKWATSARVTAVAAHVYIRAVFLRWKELANTHGQHLASAVMMRERMSARTLARCLEEWRVQVAEQHQTAEAAAQLFASRSKRCLGGSFAAWRRVVAQLCEGRRMAEAAGLCADRQLLLLSMREWQARLSWHREAMEFANRCVSCSAACWCDQACPGVHKGNNLCEAMLVYATRVAVL